MAPQDSIEYIKDGRGFRVLGPERLKSELKYRSINLCASAEKDATIPLAPVPDVVEIRHYCVIELIAQGERLLIGPERPEEKLKPHFSRTKPLFRLNQDAPPLHLSRLWLQSKSDGTRFYLGSEALNPGRVWRLDKTAGGMRFFMDEYCEAYYSRAYNKGV